MKATWKQSGIAVVSAAVGAIGMYQWQDVANDVADTKAANANALSTDGDNMVCFELNAIDRKDFDDGDLSVFNRVAERANVAITERLAKDSIYVNQLVMTKDSIYTKTFPFLLANDRAATSLSAQPQPK